MTEESPCACQLQGRIAAVPEKGERCDCQLPFAYTGGELTGKLGGSRPVTGREGGTCHSAERGCITGLQGKRLVETGERLVVALERYQHIASIVESLDMLGPDRERLVV